LYIRAKIFFEMKALETTGRIEKSGVLKLDKPLAISSKQKVRVIILYAEEDEIGENEWLTSINNNPSFAFLNDKKEDIYSLADGKPIKS
jgi:hypothetical protein